MTIVIDTLAETTISILLGAVTSLLKEKVDLTSNAKGDLEVLQRKLKRLQKALKVTDRKPFFSNERDRDLEGELKDVFYDAQDIIEEYQTRIELHKREKHSVTSWNKEALREGQTEQDLVIHKVRDVAERIVKKCGGLPLVIKTVGSMMHTKEMSLILSYDDLSPSLKSCFVYCCIYPKDYEIKKERLIMQWVAHGLIEEKESIDMEMTANQYIKDLIRRCLIEETKEGDLKLHDILHDLASYIGGKEYSHASATEHTRHLSLLGVHDADVHKCNGSGAANKLGTILLSDLYSNLPLDYIAHLTNFKWLRVLSLTRCRIHELPNYIECFSLLKYLDLSFSDVRQLPSSISRLCNLQTFDLNYSEIEELPKEMGEVRNLRYLGLKHTEELKFIAEGLGKLTNLQTLKRFLLCNDKGSTRGCNIKELKDLNKLKGKLSIKGLGGGWVKVNDAKKACLKEKHELIGVELDFKVPDDDKLDGASEHRSLLEALEPPHGIESLAICDYEGDRPVWYLDTNYAELRTLRLQHCSSWATVVGIKSLEKLEINVCPTLCELPSMPLLKSLKIWSCDGLNMIGDLPALEWLVVERCGRVEKLADMPALKSLEVYRSNRVKTLANMPALESLEVGGCASLEQVVDDHMRALKKLRLSNMNMPALKSLVCGFNRLKAPTNMPALESLEVIDCGSLEKLPYMPALKSLKVCGPNRLETLANMPALESLEVKDCGSLEQLADMPALKSLEVYRSNRLETLANMPALEWLRVKDCGSLKQLSPKSLEVFTSGRLEQVVDDHLSALKSLELYNLNTMKQLPSRLPSLEELRISDLPNWEGWPAAGLGETTISSMPCLRVADFEDCPKMQTQGLIYALSKQEHDYQPQLQELIVWDCPSARVRWKLLKQLPNLIGLTLDCAALESTLLPPLPLEVSTFLPSLKVLTLIDTNIDELKWGKVPEWVWGLSKLETLSLMGFTEDISLGGHWQCLPKLRYLRLFHFPNLESLVDVNNITPQQNDKVATTCPTDAKEQIACLSKLENLVISSCPALDLPQELMDHIEGGGGNGRGRRNVPLPRNPMAAARVHHPQCVLVETGWGNSFLLASHGSAQAGMLARV
ncbi:putative disease resistance RPP13-like protein 1 [Nymphaea thermarum]|nr:putative disease resistance RPP13-like protein 1 [Nymphaea thermarum]